MPTYPLFMLALSLVLLALGGCQPMLDAGDRRTASPMQVSKKVQSTSSAPSADTPETLTYYQLILANEAPTTPDLSTLKQIRVQHTPARTVGELLANLYLPAGQSGTPERYALMYASVQEWNAAAEVVKELDVPSTSADEATFTQAIAAYYFAVSNRAEIALWQDVVAKLKHVAAHTDETM